MVGRKEKEFFWSNKFSEGNFNVQLIYIIKKKVS